MYKKLTFIHASPSSFQSCWSNGSLSRDFTVFFIDKQDCSGGPVIDKINKIDDCGVCGGNNACADCKGVVNGSE
jgi:hypothetical protein